MSNQKDDMTNLPEEEQSLDDILASSHAETEALVDVVVEEQLLEEAIAEDFKGEEEPLESLEQQPVSDEAVNKVDPVKKTPANVEEHFNVLTPDDRGSPDTIALPPETIANVVDSLQRTPNLETADTEKSRHWNDILQSSLPYIPLQDMYTRRLNDEGSKWSQVLEYGGTRMYGAAPSNRNKPGISETESGRAILKLVTHLGIGALHRTPLYNSGFWVYFKPATETELLELNAILSYDKVNLGRDSYALAHSNQVSFTLSRVFDLALRHVYETSVKQSELPLAKLAEHIAPQDIHAFIWGFLCANYPSGFHYERACSTDPTKCTHVVKGNLSIPKTLIVDTNRLNDWQKNHMRSFAANSMTLSDVERYYGELTHLHARRVILNKGTDHEIAVTMRTPTIRQYIDQSFKYITALTDSVTRAMSVETSNKERNIAIDQTSRAEKLCQWIHFVESIEFGQLSNEEELSGTIIKDFDTIRKALATLSSADNITEQISSEIVRYVEDSTISIMAIPAYDCPVCGTPQEKATEGHYPRMASYIPLDVIQVFFGLLARRVARIVQR